MPTILIAGATGRLGRHVVMQCKARGHRVRALARDLRRLMPVVQYLDEIVRGDLTDAASLADVCRDVDTIVSCAGASMHLGDLGDRRGFMEVDYRGNVNLLEQARTSGVAKFVYVSVFSPGLRTDLEYVGAHELFVAALAASGVPYTVVRPTGFFCFFGEVLRLATRGRGVVVGNGRARTNPVDERDVAVTCARAVSLDEREIPLGGPEIYTRREIVELAFEALGRRPRITRVPSAAVNVLAAPLRPVNRRLHALLTFGAAVSRVDAVAPALGARTLRSYFAELARDGCVASESTGQPVSFTAGGRGNPAGEPRLDADEHEYSSLRSAPYPPMLPSGR